MRSSGQYTHASVPGSCHASLTLILVVTRHELLSALTLAAVLIQQGEGGSMLLWHSECRRLQVDAEAGGCWYRSRNVERPVFNVGGQDCAATSSFAGVFSILTLVRSYFPSPSSSNRLNFQHSTKTHRQAAPTSGHAHKQILPE